MNSLVARLTQYHTVTAFHFHYDATGEMWTVQYRITDVASDSLDQTHLFEARHCLGADSTPTQVFNKLVRYLDDRISKVAVNHVGPT